MDGPPDSLEEVRRMEGVYLEFVPGIGLLAAAILLVVILAAGVLYVWHQDKRRQVAAEREPLKKAA
jgi:hypothetical protein